MERYLLASLLCLAGLLSTSNLAAQGVHKHNRSDDEVTKIYAAYADSLDAIARRYETWTYRGADTLSNPYYYQLFSPATLYDAPLKHAIGELRRPMPRPDSTSKWTLLNAIGNTWADIYTTEPWLVERTEADVRAAAANDVPLSDNYIPQVSLVEKAQPELPTERDDDVDDYVPIAKR